MVQGNQISTFQNNYIRPISISLDKIWTQVNQRQKPETLKVTEDVSITLQDVELGKDYIGKGTKGKN